MMPDMPVVPLGRPASYADLLEVPEHLVAEILEGELYTSPRPAPRHAQAHSTLLGQLYSTGDFGRSRPDGWWILTEPELHLGNDVLVPDLAGWRRSRLPRLPETAYFPLAPDWVCEVISPSTAAIDRGQKLRIYSRERVAHLWIVDALARRIEVLRHDGERLVPLTSHDGDAPATLPPFEAIALETALLWQVE